MSDIAAAEKAPVNLPEQPPAEPFGISGWMVFPMLITLGSVVFNVWDFLLVAYEFWRADFQNVIETIVGVVLSAVAFGLWLYASVLLFRHSRKYPKIFIILSILTLAFVVAMSALAIAAGQYDPELPRAAGRAFFVCIVWIPYMLFSKRVRNTFVK